MLTLFDLPETKPAKPIVKWPGGKAQLLDRLLPLIDANPGGTYYEPFVGGGAALLAQTHTNAIAGDVNPSLVAMYRTIGGQHTHVAEELAHIHARAPKDHAGDYFYQLRSEYNARVAQRDFGVRHAALFITMTKWGFNGLYRVNRKGEFNASFRKQYCALPDVDHLATAAAKISQVTWRDGDFTRILADVQPGDTVFLDPPYFPIPGATVVKYSPRVWEPADHQRVAEAARTLAQAGVNIVATNHNLPEVYELWEGFTITPIPAQRRIRGGSTTTNIEVIITNQEV